MPGEDDARSLAAFTQELERATEALAELQDAAAEGAEDIGGGGGRGGGGGSGGRKAAKSPQSFAQRQAEGLGRSAARGTLAQVAQGIRGGTGAGGIAAGIGGAAADFAGNFDVFFGTGKRVDAAKLAGSRTAEITAPLARLGVDVGSFRDEQFAFEQDRARREVEELAAVQKLTNQGKLGVNPRPGGVPTTSEVKEGIATSGKETGVGEAEAVEFLKRIADMLEGMAGGR